MEITEFTPPQQEQGTAVSFVQAIGAEVTRNQVSIGLGSVLVQGVGAESQACPTNAGVMIHLPVRIFQGAEVSAGQVGAGIGRVLVRGVGVEVQPSQAESGWNLLEFSGQEVQAGQTESGTCLVLDFLKPTPEPLAYYRCGAPMGQELAIQVKGPSGPSGPVSISYCLFRVHQDGHRTQEGPPTRFPVADKSRLGRYYPVGRLEGQPGTWVIRWAVQQNFHEAIQYVEQQFVVQDALAANLSGDRTVRTLKQDWS
jgi:hypothetical protein